MIQAWRKIIPHVSESAFQVTEAADAGDNKRLLGLGDEIAEADRVLLAAGANPDDIVRARFVAAQYAQICAADLALINTEGIK